MNELSKSRKIMKKKQTVKAYKATDKDMTCRGFKYELNKLYKFDGDIELCARGFHACRKANDVFSYYNFSEDTRVFEVELSGEIVDGENKSVASEIKFIAEYNWKEILDLINTGKNNTGRANSGDSNSGYSNSGYGNSCNRSSGIFCTQTPQLFLFNKPTDKTWEEIEHPYLGNYRLTEWIDSDSMSDVDKLNNPKWETLGGYLKTCSYQEMWARGWQTDSDENKLRFFNLPNYDLAIFEAITGIDASEDFKRRRIR